MGISRRDGDFLMGSLCLIVQMCFSLAQDGQVSGPPQQVLDELPKNIRAALSTFDFNLRTTIYAVCPACHCTYPPSLESPKYPSRCTNKPSPKAGLCGEPLIQSSADESIDDDDDDSEEGQQRPIKPFVYHSVHDYLEGLLADPELEGYMDGIVDEALEFKTKHQDSVTDIWQGAFLQDMEGPHPNTLFLDRQGTGRYAFTFNYDSFLVEGLRIRGRKYSVGLLSLICLNLPPHLRANHLYVAGIIPGIKQPSLTQLNHYSGIIVDEFVDSWKRGIFYPQTALRPNGRLTHSIIAAGVMDLPAARHAAGMAGVTSNNFCTVCTLKKKVNLGNTDCANWILRDNAVLRDQAIKWRDAATERDQEEIFAEHGVRWSEFWRLPYWNPVCQLTVDVMHCILENNCSNHFREVLALTKKSAETSLPSEPPAFSHPFTEIDPADPTYVESTSKQLESASKALSAAVDEANPTYENLTKRLASCKIKTLILLCHDVSIEYESFNQARKVEFVTALVEWVRLILSLIY